MCKQKLFILSPDPEPLEESRKKRRTSEGSSAPGTPATSTPAASQVLSEDRYANHGFFLRSARVLGGIGHSGLGKQDRAQYFAGVIFNETRSKVRLINVVYDVIIRSIKSKSKKRKLLRSMLVSTLKSLDKNYIYIACAIETKTILVLLICSFFFRMKSFRASLYNLFQKERAQSVQLDQVTKHVNSEHVAEPFTDDDIMSAISAMMDENQVMLSDKIVFLI